MTHSTRLYFVHTRQTIIQGNESITMKQLYNLTFNFSSFYSLSVYPSKKPIQWNSQAILNTPSSELALRVTLKEEEDLYRLALDIFWQILSNRRSINISWTCRASPWTLPFLFRAWARARTLCARFVVVVVLTHIVATRCKQKTANCLLCFWKIFVRSFDQVFSLSDKLDP